MSLPIIDFAPYLSGDSKQKETVAKAIRAASERWGFFYLKNIGIQADQVDQAFTASRQFFALPEKEKLKIAWENAESNRGYVAYRRESLDPTRKSDLKEAYNLGTEKTERDLTDPAKNKWPESQPAIRKLLEPFIEQCTIASNHVLRALALALDIQEDTFVTAHSKEQNTFRLLHYPALDNDTDVHENEDRAGAHTDYGSITILFQDSIGGLEVQDKSGEWLSAPPIEYAVVINTGDLMQRWTNDVYKSNPHRVKQPAASRDKSRYSIAYFCTPNADEIIETIPTCITEKNPQKYQPITTQAHMLERLNRTY